MSSMLPDSPTPLVALRLTEAVAPDGSVAPSTVPLKLAVFPL